MGGIEYTGAAAEPSQDVPDGVAVQRLFWPGSGRSPMTQATQRFSRVICSSRGGSVVRCQPGHCAGARRSCEAASSSRTRSVSCLAGSRRSRMAGAALLAEPSGDGGWPVRFGEGVIEGLQLRADLPVLGAEQPAQPLLHRAAAGVGGGDTARAAPQPGQLRQKPGSGRVQAEQSGIRPAVPPRIGPVSPQQAHRSRGTTGRPGTMACRWLWRSRTGMTFPQIPQVRIFHGTQFAHSGPPGARTLTRPAAAAAGAGLLVGRIGDQALGAQRLAVLVTGRDLLDGSAPCARLGAGPGHAVTARPLPVDPPVQMSDTAAAGAWRPGDLGGAGIAPSMPISRSTDGMGAPARHR